jgi:hypothetical protein
MSVDRTKLQFYSGDKIDQIVGIYTGTISVGAPTLGQVHLSSTDSKAHGFGDSAYFEGIFSTNNGITWNDLGAQTPILTGAFPTFQTAECTAYVDATNINVKATSWYDFSNSTSHAYTFMYKVFAIAKNTMAQPITPLATNNDLFLLSTYNYQKIALQGTKALSVASGTSGSATVSHSLGYSPKVRAWWFDGASPTVCRPLVPEGTSSSYREIQVRVSTSDVTFFADNSDGVGIANTGNIEYRIYYD